MQPLFTDRHL